MAAACRGRLWNSCSPHGGAQAVVLIPKIFLDFIEKGAPWKVLADALVALSLDVDKDEDKHSHNKWLKSALSECVKGINLAPIEYEEIQYAIGCFFGDLYFAEVLGVEGLKCLRLSSSNLKCHPTAFLIGFLRSARNVSDDMVDALKDFFDGNSSIDLALWEKFVDSLNNLFGMNDEIKTALQGHLVLARQKVLAQQQLDLHHPSGGEGASIASHQL